MTNPNTTEFITLNLFICLAIISLNSHLNLIKTKKTITILLLSFSLSAQTWGNSEYWISYEYTPKSDQISDFEIAVKEKTKKWNNTLETAIFTFEVVNGPNTGTYERWVTRKDRSFFDQDFSKEIDYCRENVSKYIADQSGEQTWRIFKGAS